MEWKEPPLPLRVNMKAFVVILKANPGQWAVYGRFPPKTKPIWRRLKNSGAC